MAVRFKRDVYLKRLIDRQDNGLVKIITGTRRAGKSTLLNTIFYDYLINNGTDPDHIIKFAFDSDEDLDLLGDQIISNDKVDAKRFRTYLKSLTNDHDKFYIFLDEVQLLDNFVGTLNSLLRHPNFDIYVTGSNSKFLSSDIVTEFKGRGSEIHVLPLTFSEYAKDMDISIDKAWREYIEFGGIPLVALFKTREEKVDYLKNLVNEVYIKDIIERHNIKKTSELADVFDILASLMGTYVNPSKIANTFDSLLHTKLSKETIDQYITYFVEAFLINKVKRYNVKGRKIISTPYKIYFEDVGIRNARLNFHQIEETHIMENIIYNELRYRGLDIDVGEVNVYKKTDRKDVNNKDIYAVKTLEVDFIATKGDLRYYIQSALSLSDEDKIRQEKRSLLNIDDSFKKVIITKNGLNIHRDDKGIITMDLFDFLMDKDSLEKS